MKTKRIISFILVTLLLLSTFSFSAFAKINEKQAKEEATEPEYVVTMYICHKDRNYNLSGHTWVYFKNLTKHAVTVGIYSVPKGQGVSVGTYGYSITDGRGLYYNVEGWRYNAVNTTEFVTLKKDLTQEQLDKVNQKITKSGFWTYLVNCSWSACRIWNTTRGEFVPYLVIPPLARLGILVYKDHEEGFKLYNPKSNQIFKQDGWGDKATLVPADPSVIPFHLF